MGDGIFWAVLCPDSTALFSEDVMHLTWLTHGDATLARAVLEDLPGWFGQTEAREAYIRRASELPMAVATAEDGTAGFLSLLSHGPHHSEVYVMGVRAALRRRGIGRSLLNRALDICAETQTRYLSVKTLAASVPDARYAETRAFYEAMGFRLFEILPTHWGPHAPCALYLMDLNEKRR